MEVANTEIIASIEDVFYYNQHRNVDVSDIADCFKQMKPEEMDAIKTGDTVWLDLEPYHLNGKVYGFTQVRVVQKVDDDEIAYKSVHHQGSLVLTEHARAFKVIDKLKLARLVTQYGDKVTSPYEPGLTPPGWRD